MYVSLEPDGFSEKIGNRYESSWITFQLLRLLDEKISYVQVEPLGDDEDAVVIPPFLIELMGRKSKALLLFKNRWTTIY